MDRKSEKIKLLGYDVALSERNAEDVFAFLSFVEEQKEIKGIVNVTYLNAYVVFDALKPFINKSWFLKRWYLKRIFSKSKLIKLCTVNELAELSKKVGILEGLNPDEAEKKKAAKEFQEK